MMLAFTAALAIVVQDHAALRAAPRAGGTELERLWQGDVLEVRGEQGGYLKVYDHRHERGGYLRADAGRAVELAESAAPDLLAVLRFLRDSPGSEALGISYGAAYLKAAPARAITAEPFGAIAQMAERLADRASAAVNLDPDLAAHLDGVEQFGIHMQSVERNGRIRICYDGELFHRVLTIPGAQPEERARATLSLTRSDCIDPDLDPVRRAAGDLQRAQLLEQIKDEDVSPMTRSRLHARRAAVWAALAYASERGAVARARPAAEPGSADAAAGRALSELVAVHADELGEDLRGEYLDAVLRVSAGRWAGSVPAAQQGPLTVSVAPGDPGQTCVNLKDARRPNVEPLIRTIDVISPGLDQPEEGYVDFADYVPGGRRLLIAREVKERGRFRRSFEELRLDDLATVRHASAPELLPDFGRWENLAWRRQTLALH